MILGITIARGWIRTRIAFWLQSRAYRSAADQRRSPSERGAEPVIRSRAPVAIAVASLATMGLLTGCSEKRYWVDSVSVPIRVKVGDGKPASGFVAGAFSKEDYERAVAAIGGSPASSPQYLDLLEMNALEPKPLGEDGTIHVSVLRHGVVGPSPQGGEIRQRRHEKVVLGVYYVDGSRNAFVFDMPRPAPEAEIIAEIPAERGDPDDAAAGGGEKSD